MSAANAPSALAQAPLTLKAAGRTDIGRRRQHNEDVVLVREDLGLFVVADGAGGHNAGEVASALAARSMENYFGATIRATHAAPEFNRLGMPNGARRLSAAVHKANRDVVEIARTSAKHRGMGTTVVAAYFSPRSGLMHVAHVGDSRCYRMRDGDFELLTQDHSLLTDVLEQRPDPQPGTAPAGGPADQALAREQRHRGRGLAGRDRGVRPVRPSFAEPAAKPRLIGW